MSLAVKKNSNYSKPTDLPANCKVASKFTKTARSYFDELNIPVEIVHLTGSVFPKTLEEFAQKHHVKLPEYQSIEDLYDRSEFKSILPMLKVAVSVIRDPSFF